MIRPHRVVAVVGTGTDVGKTWVTCRLMEQLVADGFTVSARKPAQSFDPAQNEPTDADLLGRAAGLAPTDVCPAHRWYTVPMAPPMAAEALGLPPPTLPELVRELGFDPVPTTGARSDAPIDVLFVETAGGVRSPHAANPSADAIDLLNAIHPDQVLLVADAGLGTINSVRLTLGVLTPWDVVVFLNRFETGDPLHRANLATLENDRRSPVGRVIPVLTELTDAAVCMAGPPDS